MKDPYNLEPGKDWMLLDKELVFSGPPNQCVCQARLQNLSGKPLKVRYLPIQLTGNPLGTSRILFQCKLEPNSEQTVTARLDLTHDILPGDYDFNIPFGAQSAKGRVAVFENDNLRIHPKRTVICGAAGDTVSKTVNFQNKGNMDIVLPGRSMVWFEERDWLGHSLVQSFREVQNETGYEEYFNTLIKRFKKTMLPAVMVDFDIADNKSKGPDLVLKPGSGVSRLLTITLPPGLQKGKTYHGFVKIHRYRFWLALYCESGQSSQGVSESV